MFVQTIAWPQGELTAIWSKLGLCKLVFGGQPHAGQAEAYDAQAARALAAALDEYFSGGILDFPLGHLDWTGTPAFHRQVLERCARIPLGEVMTYGQLAAAVGSPGASRAVGQAMARNRWPLIVPCHRVVGSTGRLTGYSGLGGTVTKQWLLDLEGAKLSRRALDPVPPNLPQGTLRSALAANRVSLANEDVAAKRAPKNRQRLRLKKGLIQTRE